MGVHCSSDPIPTLTLPLKGREFYSFIRSFLHSFIQSLIYSPIHPFIPRLTQKARSLHPPAVLAAASAASAIRMAAARWLVHFSSACLRRRATAANTRWNTRAEARRWDEHAHPPPGPSA